MRDTETASAILGRLTACDSEMQAMVEEETLNSHIARMIFELREEAGLTQRGRPSWFIRANR
jgi:hypothetical protein